MVVNFFRYITAYCNLKKGANSLLKGTVSVLLMDERIKSNLTGEIALQVCLLESSFAVLIGA